MIPLLGNITKMRKIKGRAQGKDKHIKLDKALDADGLPLKTGSDGRKCTDTTQRRDRLTAALREEFPA
jgi:hypothetical protein